MTQFLIITSTEDQASLNIKDKLIKSDLYHFKITNVNWEDNELLRLANIEKVNIEKEQFLKENEVFLGITQNRLIYLNELKLDPNILSPDFLIFASRHASKTERPSFLVHTTGVWNDDIEYGGSPKSLSIASALLVKAGYIAIQESVKNNKISDFSLDMEVSHHGPTSLNKPLIFMELGSNQKEWNDNYAGITIANAIIETLIKYTSLKKDKSQKIGIGFGGTHYAPQFQKLISKTNIAISHICPKYFIPHLDANLINQMVKKCLEKVDYFVIDWKGVNSADKKHLIPLLEEYNISIKKIKDFF